jgi:hypothetical protein
MGCAPDAAGEGTDSSAYRRSRSRASIFMIVCGGAEAQKYLIASQF